MFVGHLALAFAGKQVTPTVSLGWFVAAVTTLDLLWPFFLLAGLEQVRVLPGATAFTPLVFDSYPWSHSLLMAVVWGGVLAGVARWRGIGPNGALLLAALVVSHWVLDFISHAPDMPLWPGDSPRLGLSLWDSIGGTFMVEGSLWVAAIAWYLRSRRATRRIGPVALWSLIFICTGMWAAGPWSPPPPNSEFLGWFGLIGWIVLPWAALADHYYVTASPD